MFGDHQKLFLPVSFRQSRDKSWEMSQRASGSTTPNSTGQSTPPPPSAYRSSVLNNNSSTLLGLGAAASAFRPLRNRLSRNFEDILREDNTVQLRAGNLDESKLGVVFTPPSASRTADYSFNSTLSGTDDDNDDDEQTTANLRADSGSPTNMSRQTRNAGQPTFNLQPATPIVIPPTPLASNSPADPAASNTTIDSSVEDSLEHTRPNLLPISQPLSASPNTSKRRSLLRSPGTSSSPDLATLVRKARERGGIIGSGTHFNDTSNKAEKDATSPAAATTRPTTSSGSATQPIPEVVLDPSGPTKQTRPTTSNGPSSFLAPNPNPNSSSSSNSNNRTRTTSSTSSSFSVVNTPEPPSSTPYAPFGGSNASTARLVSATISASGSKKLSKQSQSSTALSGLGLGSEISPHKGMGIAGGKEPPKVGFPYFYFGEVVFWLGPNSLGT